MAVWNERIRQRRLERGLTLAQVADKLQVTEATAQRYESGSIKNVPYEHMCTYAEIFNCSPSYLMGWSEETGDSLIDYFDNTLEDVISFIEKNGYIVLQAEKVNDDTIIIKTKDGKFIKGVTDGFLVGQYEKMKVNNLPRTIENLLELNVSKDEEFPENIRVAARGMMDLSPEDQEMALNMIKRLSQKGREALEN